MEARGKTLAEAGMGRGLSCQVRVDLFLRGEDVHVRCHLSG